LYRPLGLSRWRCFELSFKYVKRLFRRFFTKLSAYKIEANNLCRLICCYFYAAAAVWLFYSAELKRELVQLARPPGGIS
jgi:hypothetical protein